MKKFFVVALAMLISVAVFPLKNADSMGGKVYKESNEVYIHVHSQYIHQISLNYKGYYLVNKSWSDRAGTWRHGVAGFYKHNKKIREGESGKLFIGWYNNSQTENIQQEKNFTFKVNKQSWVYGPSGSRMKVEVRWAPEYSSWFLMVSDN